MSILQTKPGARVDTGLFALVTCLLLIAELLYSATAHGFTVTQSGGSQTVRITRRDIAQDGSPLMPNRQQVYDQGTIARNLNDLSQPLDLNLSGAAPGTMTAQVSERHFLRIRLSNAERGQCLDDSNFLVSYRAVGPPSDVFLALDAGGGDLRVLNITASFTESQGNNCPRDLIYGFALDLNVDNAISSNDYQSTIETTVELLGPGGSTQVTPMSLLVDMPEVLLLYHHGQVNIDMQASALAGALGATAVCGGGYCSDVGDRLITVSNLAAPIVLSIGTDAPILMPLHTVSLKNAVGARALGCAGGIYDTATYQVLNPTGGIQASNGVITGIQNSACGFDLRSGDLSFDLDLNSIDSSTNATATIQITVTGL